MKIPHINTKTRLLNFMNNQRTALEPCRNLGMRTIIFSFMNTSHFFDRLEDRSIDKGQVGTLFSNILTKYFCRLFFEFEVNSYEYTMRRRTTLVVSYKNVIIPFSVNKKETAYELVPATALTRSMKAFRKTQQCIFLDMDTDEITVELGEDTFDD